MFLSILICTVSNLHCVKCSPMHAIFHSLSHRDAHTFSLTFPSCPLKNKHSQVHTHTQSWSLSSVWDWPSLLLHFLSEMRVWALTSACFMFISHIWNGPDLQPYEATQTFDLQMQRIKLMEKHLCKIMKQTFHIFYYY